MYLHSSYTPCLCQRLQYITIYQLGFRGLLPSSGGRIRDVARAEVMLHGLGNVLQAHKGCWHYSKHGIWSLGMSIALQPPATPLAQITFQSRGWARRSLSPGQQCVAALRPRENWHIFESCRIIPVSASNSLPQKLLGKAEQNNSQYSCWFKTVCCCLTHKALYSHVFPKPAVTLSMVVPATSFCCRHFCFASLPTSVTHLFLPPCCPFWETRVVAFTLDHFTNTVYSHTARGRQNAVWGGRKNQGNTRKQNPSFLNTRKPEPSFSSQGGSPAPPKNNPIPNIWTFWMLRVPAKRKWENKVIFHVSLNFRGTKTIWFCHPLFWTEQLEATLHPQMPCNAYIFPRGRKMTNVAKKVQ